MERNNKLLLMFISLFIFLCPIVAKADVTNYDVWVGETQVNSDNKDNIDGSNRVSYNPDTSTLTLDNFNYAGESDGKTFELNSKTYHAAIYAEGNLNINVIGNTALIPTLPTTGGNYGIYVDGNLNINGSSSKTLTIGVIESAEDNYGIYTSGSFAVSNVALSINSGNSTNANSYGISAGSMTFNDTTSSINSSKSYTMDSSGLITNTGAIEINNSNITATGGIVSGINDSKSYGMKSATTIIANGTSEVTARGGSANSGNDLTQNNNSFGVYSTGNVILNDTVLFKSYAGNSSKSISYGIDTLGQLILRDEAEYHASGYTKAMNVTPTYDDYSAYVITFSDVNQQHQENRGGNSLDPTAFDTAKYVKIKPAALVNFSNDAVITWPGLTNDEISYGIVYDGTVKTPEVHVMYDGLDLVENIDYTVSYQEGRKNVGTYEVYVTGMGNFSGVATKTFKIRAAEIDSLTINQSVLPYNGQSQTPNETVQSGSIVLSTDDYDIIYYSGTVVLEENQIDYTRVRDVGAYTLLIKAKGNFTGELSKLFYIDTVVISSENTTITFDHDSFEYTGNTIRPVVTVVTNGGELINGVDYEIVYPNSSVDIGNYEVTINGINNYEGTLSKSYSITKAVIGELVLSNEEYTYNGNVQVPTVAVTKGNQVLTKNVDYELVYSNDQSINHGTYTITATGINNYEGTLEKTYVINKAPITDLVLDNEEFVYNEQVQTPNIVVTSNGVALTEDTDYEITLPEGRTNVGTYTVTATGINNYEGTLSKSYEIYAKAITDVSFSTEEFTYNGNVQTPVVTVYSFGKELVLNQDYEITMPEGMTNAGEYIITITGINNYQGTIQKSYVINPKMITEAYLDQTEYTYDGTAHRPTETVKSDDVVLTTDDYDINFYVGATQIPVNPNSMINAGSYTAIVEGKGNYTGHYQLPFNINPISITGESITMTLDAEHYYYTGENVHPTLTVKNGDNVLVRNEDYELVYPAESTEVNRSYLLIVRGINNYTGQVEVPFIVEPAPILEEDITLNPSVLEYTGTNLRPRVIITKNNRTLEEGTDYDVVYPSVSIECGSNYTVTITGKGNYTGTVNKTYSIVPANVKNANLTISPSTFTYNGKVQKPSSVIVELGGKTLTQGTDYNINYSNSNSVNAGPYEVTITGKGNYTGSIKKTYKINPKKITNVTLSQTRFVYNGKERLPDVRVKSGTTVLSSYHYNVKYSNGRKNIGTYTVTVTGKGNYTGSVKLSYIIVPKTTKIKSLTPGSKKVKVTWKKGTKGITDGYQIRYSKKSNFSKPKYKNIKGQKKYKKTIKKLKKNKKYYFQIRTYKVVSGKKYYSDWSKTKKAKIK